MVSFYKKRFNFKSAWTSPKIPESKFAFPTSINREHGVARW